jgi:hypothetical protein
MKIKRALANRPGRHRRRDMHTENSEVQATSRNLQFNFGDFPRLVLARPGSPASCLRQQAGEGGQYEKKNLYGTNQKMAMFALNLCSNATN